ncbi:MAG: DUF4386 domain-containing protein [Terriglobales bacterium]
MIITLACDTGVALILYDLLKPVGRSLSLIAALFRLIFVAVRAVNSLSYFDAVVLFQNAHSSAAFDTGYGIAMVPFGLHWLLIGYLIFEAISLPRILGVLLVLAGLGYLTFLWPRLGSHLCFPYILIPGIVGEGSLVLWLVVMGVNVQQWKDQANGARADGGPSGS